MKQTPEQMSRIRLRILLSALKLETLGMKRRGRSAYAIAKEEYSLKGNRAKVYAQLEEIFDQS